MNLDYYGPTKTAEQVVNRLLALEATGREQDWEIELADPGKLGAMLDILEREPLTSDVKAALCLLMLSSFELALDDAGEADAALMHRAATLLQRDLHVLSKMRFYWLELERTSHPETLKSLLSA